jgi:hypothetical protein
MAKIIIEGKDSLEKQIPEINKKIGGRSDELIRKLISRL